MGMIVDNVHNYEMCLLIGSIEPIILSQLTILSLFSTWNIVKCAKALAFKMKR